EIPVADIKAAYSTFALDDIPFYYFDWDITGQYDRYPDGTYLVRAVSNCGATGGQIFSEEITGTIRRSALILKGIPEPADQVWVNGDEISASYSRDLSCGLISTPSSIVNNFQLLDRTAGDVPVAFDLICNNGKLIMQPKEDLRVYDGHTLVAIYQNVPDVSGNVAEDIEWPFKVIAQQADWQEQEIVVRMYQGDQITKKSLIFNTTGNQVTGLNLTRADASSSAWLTMDPMNNLVIPAAGQTITFSIDGNRAPGDYTDDIAITGMAGRIPVIKVKATILPPPPATENIVKRENEMELVANWRFEDFNLTSVDSLDQIQVLIDGQVRGLANIKAVGPFYAAIIKIQGNASDAGKMLQFRVWHGNALTLYEGVALSGIIQFGNGTKVGSLDAPELIIVKDAIVVSINEVRPDNVFKLSSYPNPFAEVTNIRFELDQPKDALIQIFNVMGQMVYEEKGYYASGEHQIRFNSTAGMAGGMYYVLMQSDGQIATHRMILIR
ncbi:MAG: T9SS type A sorting domain-containing protein, partial [Saprospiraceae bacterium]|nr:T9SS type A sorting domain-containing protein [Saprospiraceae bacterium]